jgi:hypothetical protein
MHVLKARNASRVPDVLGLLEDPQAAITSEQPIATRATEMLGQWPLSGCLGCG